MADNEKTLQFIEDYRSYHVLWDQNHIDYTNKTKRNNALTALGKKYKIDMKMVKNKIKSLRSYFSKEHQKVLTKNISAGPGDYYQSPWFAYNSLSFILDSITPRETGESKQKNTSEDPPEAVTEDESNDSHATPAPEDEHEFVQPIRRKRNINKDSKDEKEEEAYRTMKRPAEKMGNNDGCNIFGELIANKLRNLNRRNRIIAERRICNILFDLELEEIDAAPLNQD